MVFGMVEKKGPRCILRLVDTNSKEQLIPIITKYVEKDCKIHHDGLAKYTNLHHYGYEHEVVNHSEEFVTKDGIHTNKIEGVWGLIKQKISYMHGLPNYTSLAAHLDEFSYRSLYKFDGDITKVWDSFLKHVKECGYEALNISRGMEDSEYLIDPITV